MRELKAVELTIQANTEKKIAQSIRPVNVVTDLHQEPSLPATVTVEYDKGFLKLIKSLGKLFRKKN